MLANFLLMPACAAAELVTDIVLRAKVTPKVGSIVYCDLALGYAEHSGVYIGDNKIVHLNRHGDIEVVTPRSFIKNTPAIGIYVSCHGPNAKGCKHTAQRAENMVGKKRDYNVFFNNCHQFSSGCLTGDFENSDNLLLLLKYTANDKLKVNSWRVWDIELFG